MNHEKFSPAKIAQRLITEVYTKEALQDRDLKVSEGDKYRDKEDMDLAEIYNQINREKFPEVYEDLLATIKLRVESSGV